MDALTNVMACTLCIVFISFILRTVYLVVTVISNQGQEANLRGNGGRKPLLTAKLMIIAGSGGHTTEILRIVSSLGRQYTPKVYISADTDHISKDKIKELENSITQKDRYEIVTIPRSREVNQSWMSTVLSTFYACVYAIPILLTHRPDVVLCNGPGTCIPICGAAFLLKVLYVKRTRIIFVESICRVKTLSLSGKMLYYFADELLVQWPSLLDLYGRCRYIGRFV